MTYLFIGIALGLVLGGVIGWLMGSRHSPAAPVDDRLAGERDRAEREPIVPEARVAKALGAEEHQPEPGEREMRADRDDQQADAERQGRVSLDDRGESGDQEMPWPRGRS